MTGIEPAFRAWEARVLPLNYTRRARDLILLIAAVVLVACGGGEAEVRPAGALAPDAFATTATGVDGTQIDLGSYAGRDVVVWFWAPW
ncbi:MAG: Redoxin [Acidimicrobiaceae bacterium]